MTFPVTELRVNTLVLHQKSTVVPRGQLAIALAQLMWGFPPDCYRGRGEGKLTRSIRSTGRNSALIDEARHVEEVTVLCYHVFIHSLLSICLFMEDEVLL